LIVAIFNVNGPGTIELASQLTDQDN